jgi:hypothetical protein
MFRAQADNIVAKAYKPVPRSEFDQGAKPSAKSSGEKSCNLCLGNKKAPPRRGFSLLQYSRHYLHTTASCFWASSWLT